MRETFVASYLIRVVVRVALLINRKLAEPGERVCCRSHGKRHPPRSLMEPGGNRPRSIRGVRQRSAAVAERDRLQPGEPVAAAGAAPEGRGLELDRLLQRLVKTGGRLVKHAR